MSAHKHTPPPWSIYRFEEGILEGHQFIGDKDSKSVASLSWNIDPEEAWANARLIAAAPELLEALELLEEAAESYAADQDTAVHPDIGNVQPVTVADCNALNAALLKARAAITKATEKE